LERKTGLDFVNMGIPGHSTVHNFYILEKYVLPLNPKLVIWLFFPNDLNNNYDYKTQEHQKKIDEFIKNYRKLKPALSEKLKRWLSENVILYELVKYLFKKHTTSISEHYQTLMGTKRIFFYIPYWKSILENPKIKDWRDINEQYFLRAKKLCDGLNTRLIIVIAPAKERTYWFLTGQEYTKNIFDREIVRLKNFFDKNGILYIDLTETFEEYAKDGRVLYYPAGFHWNKQGNNLVADIIVRHLKREGITQFL
jgi:hypothetical protein